MTKQEIINWTRAIYEEANAADPYGVEEAARAIIGAEAWVWSNLTVSQLNRLSRFCFTAALAARA
jgi:hypothetical protein